LCVVLKCKSTNKKFQIQGQEQVEKFKRKEHKGKNENPQKIN